MLLATLASFVAGKLTYLTAVILGTAILVLLAYNVVAALNKKPDDTLGEVIVSVIRDHPILVFLAGFVCGHLFWN